MNSRYKKNNTTPTGFCYSNDISIKKTDWYSLPLNRRGILKQRNHIPLRPTVQYLLRITGNIRNNLKDEAKLG